MATNPNQSATLNRPTAVLTPKARLSFPALLKPRSFEGSEAKYSAVLIFPVSADVTALRAAVEAAKAEKWGGKQVGTLRLPFRKGEEKTVEMEDGSTGYAEGYGPSTFFLSASSKTKPQLVDRANKLVSDAQAEEMFYAGCYVRAYINAFGYDTRGNKGISFGLNALQFVDHGEILGGRLAATSVFGALPDEGGAGEGGADDPNSLFG